MISVSGINYKFCCSVDKTTAALSQDLLPINNFIYLLEASALPYSVGIWVDRYLGYFPKRELIVLRGRRKYLKGSSRHVTGLRAARRKISANVVQTGVKGNNGLRKYLAQVVVATGAGESDPLLSRGAMNGLQN